MLTAEQIKNIRVFMDMNQQEFADKLGVHKRSVANYESGQTAPNARTLLKIEQLSQKYIENESKQMQINEPSEVFVTKSGNRIEQLPNGKYKLFTRLVHVKAQASYIGHCDDAEFIEDLVEVSWTLDRIPKGSYRSFEIVNDSMNDGTINSVPSGSYVLGRELGRHLWKDGLRYKQYDKWIIVHKDTVMCKQIVKHDIESGKITLHSFNPSPEYSQDFEVHLDDVLQLYNIVKRQID